MFFFRIKEATNKDPNYIKVQFTGGNYGISSLGMVDGGQTLGIDPGGYTFFHELMHALGKK